MTPPAPVSPALRRARAAVAGYFAVNAFAFALWAARVPAVKQQLGLSDTRLGVALLMVAVGALIAMQGVGAVIDRIGAVAVARVAGALMPAALVLPAYAGSFAALGAALAVLGAASGALDVAMNARGVEVERAYGRPILSSFHGVWSLAAAAGGGAGALMLHAEVPTLPALAVPGVLLSCATVPAALAIRGGAPSRASAADDPTHARAAPAGAVLLLGGLTFAAFLAEGTATDWSAVYMRETLGARGGTVALGFTGFQAAMTLGRLSGDRVVARFGRLPVLRAGAVLALAGLATVIAARSPLVAIVGWTIAGAGLASMAPQLFSAAGELTAEAGRSLARVATIGYLGFVAGPPIVGAIADASSLRLALLLPAAFTAGIVALAPMVRRRGDVRASQAPTRGAE